MLFEEKVLMRIFGPKRVEVTGQWRTLHKKRLNDLCFTQNNIRVIKSRRMRSACSMYGGEKRRGEVNTEYWWGSLG